MAASGRRLVGRARHGERPVEELEVVLVGLQLVGGDRAGLVDDLVEGLVDGDAADGQRARPVGVEPDRADGGVGVEHLDVVDRDAELVGHQHRPRRLVALAVGRGAAHDLDLVGREHPDRGLLPAAGAVVERRQHPGGSQPAHLEVARHADAEVLAWSPSCGAGPARPARRRSRPAPWPSWPPRCGCPSRTPARSSRCTGTARGRRSCGPAARAGRRRSSRPARPWPARWRRWPRAGRRPGRRRWASWW